MDDEQRDSFEGDSAEEAIDGVIVIAQARPLEPMREGPPPFVQVAAVAATGFVAGAATAAVLGRRFSRVQARRAAGAGSAPVAVRRAEPFEVRSSRRYVVDVHTISPR